MASLIKRRNNHSSMHSFESLVVNAVRLGNDQTDSETWYNVQVSQVRFIICAGFNR